MAFISFRMPSSPIDCRPHQYLYQLKLSAYQMPFISFPSSCSRKRRDGLSFIDSKPDISVNLLSPFWLQFYRLDRGSSSSHHKMSNNFIGQGTVLDRSFPSDCVRGDSITPPKLLSYAHFKLLHLSPSCFDWIMQINRGIHLQASKGD